MLTLEKQQRLNSFFAYTSRISNVRINLEKTADSYSLDIEVPASVKPLTVQRLNLVQDILGFSDIFDYIKIKVPTEPLQVLISTTGTTLTVIPTEQYTIVVNESIGNFNLKIGDLTPIVVTNNYNPSNFSDCNLVLTLNDQVSASKTQVYVTDSAQLSTIKNELFTFYYLNTGSLILGFTPSSKPYSDPSYYSYYNTNTITQQQTPYTLTEKQKEGLMFVDPLRYNILSL